MSASTRMLFEQNFDEQILNRGSEIFQDGRVLELTETEKNLYTAVVRDGKDYEVEVYKPFTKTQKFSCECLFFKANGICKHQAALLFAVRSHIQDILDSKEEKKKVVKTEKRAYHSLTIGNILNQINQEDLTDFVRNYSKTDKKFALAFKIHFARKIDLQDNEAKYKGVLDALIKPVTGLEDRVKASDVRAFVHAVEELVAQAGDTTALGQYAESFHILKNCINKVSYSKTHYNYFHTELAQLSNRLHEELAILMQQTLSIELKENIEKYISELSETSYYRYEDINHNIVRICIDLGFLDHTAILEILYRQVEKTYRTDTELCVIYAFIYHLTGKKQVLELPQKHYNLYETIINQLISAGWLENASRLAESMIKKFPKSFNYRFTYIALLLKLKQDKGLSKVFIESYLATSDLRFIDLAKDVLDKSQFDALCEEIKFMLKKKKNSDQSQLSFYARAELYTDLIELLEQLSDFRYLMNYDKLLYEKYSERLAQLYEHMVEDFLTTHVGAVSNTFIDEVISHFQKQKMPKLINKIVLLIEMKFPHRSRLINIYK